MPPLSRPDDELVDRAAVVLATHDDGLTLESIAATIGVPATELTRHCAGVDVLHRIVVQRALRAARALLSDLESLPDGREHLPVRVRLIVSRAFAHRGLTRYVSARHALLEPAVGDEIAELGFTVRRHLTVVEPSAARSVRALLALGGLSRCLELFSEVLPGRGDDLDPVALVTDVVLDIVDPDRTRA